MSDREVTPKSFKYKIIQPLTNESLTAIKELIDKENARKSELMNSTHPDHAIISERQSYTLLLNQYFLVLKDIEKNGSSNNFAVLAMDGSNVAGFTLLGVDMTRKVTNSFIGLAWDYQKKGLATELARKALSHFRTLGISEIEADMWQGSLQIAQRLKEEEHLEIIKLGGNRYLIKIRQQE